MQSKAALSYFSWLLFSLLLLGNSPLIGQTRSLYRLDDQLSKRQASATAYSKFRDSLYQKNQAQAKIKGLLLRDHLPRLRPQVRVFPAIFAAWIWELKLA
jgi:hypothetical protein